MSDDQETLEGRIRERAYHLWVESGCPEGRAQDFWFLAREAETGSLIVQRDSPTPAEEQLMSEVNQSEVQIEHDANSKTGGMKPKEQATMAPSTGKRS